MTWSDKQKNSEIRRAIMPLLPQALVVADRRLGKDTDTTWSEYKEVVATMAIDIAMQTLTELHKRFPAKG